MWLWTFFSSCTFKTYVWSRILLNAYSMNLPILQWTRSWLTTDETEGVSTFAYFRQKIRITGDHSLSTCNTLCFLLRWLKVDYCPGVTSKLNNRTCASVCVYWGVQKYIYMWIPLLLIHFSNNAIYIRTKVCESKICF